MTAITSTRSFAAALRGRRAQLGLSQAELATRAGISRQWISEFEGGKSTAELGLVLRLVEALGLHLEVVGPGERLDLRPHVDLDAHLEDLHRS